jgi:hypothetical protein
MDARTLQLEDRLILCQRLAAYWLGGLGGATASMKFGGRRTACRSFVGAG